MTQYQTMNRRSFVKRMAILATLAGAGHLPVLGAESGNGSGIDADTGPAAVKPISGYMQKFSPSGGNVTKHRDCKLTYDIVHWSAPDLQAGVTENDVPGTVEIRWRSHNGEVRYEILQKVNFAGLHNLLEAQIVCASDTLNALRSWNVRTYSTYPSGDKVPFSEMIETGESKNGRITVEEGGYDYSFTAKHPVVSQWTVLNFLMYHAANSTSATFDLLQDLSLFKANQTIFFDETMEVTVKDGHKVNLDSYAQIGEGVLPIHYLLDEQRRPQLVTNSIVSWALRDIS